MATKRNIDINRIRRSGGSKITTGIYIGNGSGNRECNYVVKGKGGTFDVEYDKVTYELSLTNHNNIDANGGTWNSSDRVSTNKRTHGNNDEDLNLALSPSTYTIGANTSTAETRTGTITLTQYSGSEEFSDYQGASETFTWTQVKDYPVSIALSLGTPPVIPASGGSVNSVSYTATTTFKSGTVSTGYGSVSWTGVTVGSKGTTQSSQTTAGTLTGNVTYTCNGYTVTGTASTTVYQEANAVVSYDAPTGLSLSVPSDIPAGGGTVTATVNGTCSQVRHWTSLSTDTIYPSASYTAPSQYAGSLGTTIKARTLISTKSMTYTANSKSSTTNSVDFYQQANNVSAWETTGYTSTGSLSYSGNIPYSGGTKSAASKPSVIANQKRTYTSGSYDTQTVTTTISYTTSTAGFSVDSNATVTADSYTGSTTRSATINWTGGDKSGSASVTQDAKPEDKYITLSPNSWAPSDAATSTTVTVSANVTWTATSNATWLHVSPTSATGGQTVTISVDANSSTSSRSSTISFAGEGANASFSVTQAAHADYYVRVLNYPTEHSSALSMSWFGIAANTSWTLSVSEPSWTSLDKYSGTGNENSIKITTSANTGNTARTVVITVTPGAGTATPPSWTLTQAGKPVETVTWICNWIGDHDDEAEHFYLYDQYVTPPMPETMQFNTGFTVDGEISLWPNEGVRRYAKIYGSTSQLGTRTLLDEIHITSMSDNSLFVDIELWPEPYNQTNQDIWLWVGIYYE